MWGDIDSDFIMIVYNIFVKDKILYLCGHMSSYLDTGEFTTSIFQTVLFRMWAYFTNKRIYFERSNSTLW